MRYFGSRLPPLQCVLAGASQRLPVDFLSRRLDLARRCLDLGGCGARDRPRLGRSAQLPEQVGDQLRRHAVQNGQLGVILTRRAQLTQSRLPLLRNRGLGDKPAEDDPGRLNPPSAPATR